MTAHRVEQRMNDINTNGDGPNRIQTATGGDKPQTAGGTPRTNPTTKPKDKRPSGGVLSSRGDTHYTFVVIYKHDQRTNKNPKTRNMLSLSNPHDYLRHTP